MTVDHGERLYFAYGSNINIDQMAMRCPDATVAGPVTLEGYELLFRGNAGGSGVATIEPLEGETVHGLLWKITLRCEQSLDRYEGYPHLYEKQEVVVHDQQGNEIPVMAYVMTNEFWRTPVMPSQNYYAGIADGYIQNGLPIPALELAVRNTHDEIRQNKFFDRTQAEQSLFGKPSKKKHTPQQER